MNTVLIILGILVVIVIVYLLVKPKKPTTSTTTTVDTTTTTETTVVPDQFWYVLYRCDDGLTYHVGPFTGTPDFSTGMRVEGATGIFYTVTSTTNTQPPTVITGVTNTGQMGC